MRADVWGKAGFAGSRVCPAAFERSPEPENGPARALASVMVGGGGGGGG